MFDYRPAKSARRLRPRQKSASPRLATPRLSSVRMSSRATARRTRSNTNSNPDGLVHKLKQFLIACFLLVVIGVGGVWIGLAFVMPRLIPLDHSTMMVFVNENKAGTDAAISLAFLDVNKEQLSVMTLSANDSVPVVGGFGEYPLRSVYRLLSLDNQSLRFIKSAYSFALGGVVHELVVVPEGQALPMTQSELRQILLQQLKPGGDSTLSYGEKLAVLGFVTERESNQIEEVSFGSLAEWQGWLESHALATRQLTCMVAVVNATDTDGLARQVSEVVEASGLTVIRVSQQSTPQTITQVVTKSSTPNCDRAAESVGEVLPVSSDHKRDDQIANQYRADIVVLLGKDVANVVRPPTED